MTKRTSVPHPTDPGPAQDSASSPSLQPCLDDDIWKLGTAFQATHILVPTPFFGQSCYPKTCKMFPKCDMSLWTSEPLSLLFPLPKLLFSFPEIQILIL